MEKLIKVLKSSPINDYRINVVESESSELFYVLDKLETNRATKVKEINVTIYIDREQARGSASFVYYDYMDEEEIKKIIEEKIYAAQFALNQYYEIPGKSEEIPVKIHSNFENRELSDIASDVARAIFKSDNYKEGFLSATEIFITKKNFHIINSRGIDVRSEGYEGYVEVIPSWGKGEDEVETYNYFTFSNVDLDDITKKIDELLLLTKARHEAKPLEVKEGLKVIIEDEGVPAIISYFTDDLSYASKYQHQNRCDVGDKIQGEKVEGDLLNVELVPIYENNAIGQALDRDGIILKPIKLIENGVALARHGSYQFGYYLGEKNPTGILPITKVAPGNKTLDDMKKEPYIRCVRFSSFQMEDNSGYFGGEVRLGFYFDGEKEIPVTGFSIGGTLKELAGHLVLSKEMDATAGYVGPVYRGYVGPKRIEIKGMNII